MTDAGTFQRIAPIVAGPCPFMIAAGDVNGDGRPDIVVANFSGHAGDSSGDGLTWIRNDGHRHFTAFPNRIVTGRSCSRIAAGDLNGDGFADVALVKGGDDAIAIVYGSKDGPRPGPVIRTMPNPHNVVIANRRVYVITEDRDEIVVVP